MLKCLGLSGAKVLVLGGGAGIMESAASLGLQQGGFSFDNCVIPKDMCIGEEGMGFKYTMYNFNHERFYIAIACNRLARVCLEESIKVRD